MLSFPRYAFTHLVCHLRQIGLENLYTPYLCSGQMQVNTLDHVYGRCILRWHNLTSSYTLSSAEAALVRVVGQSCEGVPGLPSPSIHSPWMTCLRFRLSIASIAGTLRLWWSSKLTFVPQNKQSVLKLKDCSVLLSKERRPVIELSLSFLLVDIYTSFGENLCANVSLLRNRKFDLISQSELANHTS